MKKQLTLTVILFLLSFTYSFAQKDSSNKPKSDTILILTYQETLNLLTWIDSQNSGHQEVKSIESFIQKHIQIISEPADKPKKQK